MAILEKKKVVRDMNFLPILNFYFQTTSMFFQVQVSFPTLTTPQNTKTQENVIDIVQQLY